MTDSRRLWVGLTAATLADHMAADELPIALAMAVRTTAGELIYITVGGAGRVRRHLVADDAEEHARAAAWAADCTTSLDTPDTPEGLNTDA